jgi:hypothetical protein
MRPILYLSLVLLAQTNSRDMRKEAAIWDQLRIVAPELVDTFTQATEKMDAGDFKTCASEYQKIVDAAPAFDPGMRRLGVCLCSAGDTATGLPLLERAVQLNRSPENLTTLAQFLVFVGPGKTASQESKERALTLIVEATQKAPVPDYGDLYLLAQIAGSLQKENEFRQAVRQLDEKFPNMAGTHYLDALRAAMDERWTEAEDEIHRAEALGLPADVAKEFLDSGVHRRAAEWRYAFYSLYVVLAWVVGLALLFVFGKTLSRMTLRSIEQPVENSSVAVSSKVVQLRRFYRKLIDIAGWYYYISLPFVVILLIVALGSVFYAFFAIGRVPLRLMLILVIVTLGTIYKMVQTLFIKVKPEDPGRSLKREEAPGLWALTDEVAKALDTRPVQEIRITAVTDLAVYERGSRKEKAQDKGTRILILGIGALSGFRTQAFRAVLAHEYGHFTHRDTAGGDVAFRVNNDMMNFAYAMAMSGHAVWWNLGFQFVRIYHFLFRRISHGASRLQEVLADRTAALKYGADAFEEGLKHVIRRSVEFPHVANREIALAIDGRRALHNLYELPSDGETSVEEEIEKTLNRQTSEDDTHPSPSDRFRLVRQVHTETRSTDTTMVWDLFQNREAVTQEMSGLIDQSIDRSAMPVPDSDVPTFKEVDL